MVDMDVNAGYMYASLSVSVSVMGWDKMEDWKLTPLRLSLPAFFLRLDPAPPVTTAPCQHALSKASV
jgi:hypothetical protein